MSAWSAMELVRAGEFAVERARTVWKSDVRDFRQGRQDSSAREWQAAISLMIRSPLGLGWTWEDAYAGDGDFEWCGAFVAYCWEAGGLRLEHRYKFLASTGRLDRWASYRPWKAEKNLRPAAGGLRGYIKLDETHLPGTPIVFADGSEPRAGDILMVGGENTGPGKHICLVESFDARTSTFSTIEGNAWGLGPDSTAPRQGVIRSSRRAGLHHGQGRATYHARRVIRPSLLDLDLDVPAPRAA